MDSKDVFPNKPRTIAELLPQLSGIISKETMRSLTTAKKQPRPTIAATRTTEKTLKPMTIAEIRAIQQALQPKSPKNIAQVAASTKKRWNSSVKVTKIVSRTGDGQIKNNPVRKVLDFQQPQHKLPKTSANSNKRMTVNVPTPKFPKPEINASKPTQQACNLVRISGVCHIPETPLLINKPLKNRMIIANKENQPNVRNKIAATPKSSLRKRIMASQIPDTPLSKVSWNSSCDASFLQNEREIEYNEVVNKALTEETMLENIAEVSPPVSTPFKEYRNVKEYFNNSSDVIDNSTAAYQDNTIMCFDKTSISKENNREESVIVSLCDMLNKAAVSRTDTKDLSTELDYLLDVEKQTEKDLKMVENCIETLKNVHKSHLRSLYHVRKLINEKQKEKTSECENKTLMETKEIPKFGITEVTPKKPPISKPGSIIKSCLKSPSYKIPKKNTPSLHKKMFYKSLPNTSKVVVAPHKDMGERAMNVYMKMKEQMNFLSTPLKQQPMATPDTPAVTSQNLQMQLDKLYSES